MQLSAEHVESWMSRIEDALAEQYCLTTPRSDFLRAMHIRMQMSAHGMCITQSQMDHLQQYLPVKQRSMAD